MLTEEEANVVVANIKQSLGIEDIVMSEVKNKESEDRFIVLVGVDIDD